MFLLGITLTCEHPIASGTGRYFIDAFCIASTTAYDC